MRFLDDTEPIKQVKSDKRFNSLLVPFVKQSGYIFFHPDKSGKCASYIQKADADLIT